MLSVGHEESWDRFTYNFKTLFELWKVYLCCRYFLTKNMVFVLSEKSAMGAYFLVSTSFTYQFFYLPVIDTIFVCWIFFIILSLITGILLQIFYHVYHNYVFGHIFWYIFTDDDLSWTYIANINSSISLYRQAHYYTLFAKSMTTFRNNSRHVIVEIILLMTKVAMWW